MLKGRTSPEATAQAWMERKNNYYLDLVQTITPKDVLPGVLALLAEIKANGFKAAIASSSKNAPLVISKLALQPYFDAIVDGLKVTKSKPAPDLFLQAAIELKATPEESVIFEDAAAGIDAGKAAGMATVGLGPQERVGHADIVLPGLQGVALKDILARL
ncbi:Beta-phosphoglucomutase [bioreactor metagenome]|uniref:Beta-phosphoglucomutase n=1 Tax=bioreactor metagenome TaxID=1076179 RepID=A0A645E3T3_9ZZZZ